MALTAPGFYDRVRAMLPEMLKFGIVGGLGTVIDLGGAAVLHSSYQVEPLAAKAVSVTIATALTYLGSRFWTFKHRENQSVRREAVLFVVLNVVGLLIAEAVIGLMTYVMGLNGPLEYNAASFIGTGFGTIFRFWAYRKWVFLDPGQAPVPVPAPVPAPARLRTPAFPDYPPLEFAPSLVAATEATTQAMPPIRASEYSSPWEREPASTWERVPASTWERELAPSSWGAPPQPAPLSAPTLPSPTFPGPAQHPQRLRPPASRASSAAPRSGGRHRKT